MIDDDEIPGLTINESGDAELDIEKFVRAALSQPAVLVRAPGIQRDLEALTLSLLNLGEIGLAGCVHFAGCLRAAGCEREAVTALFQLHGALRSNGRIAEALKRRPDPSKN